MGKNHPGLFRESLKIKLREVHWLLESQRIKKKEKKEYMVRIRHRQSLQKASLYINSDYLYILFNNPQRGIAKGQFAAWYQQNTLIGSGPIA